MRYKNYSCIICSDAITNPVCPVCFLRWVTAWLNESKIPKEIQKKIYKDINDKVNDFEITPSETGCIICGFKEVNVCMYCLIWETNRILERYIPKKETINKFKETFNKNI